MTVSDELHAGSVLKRGGVRFDGLSDSVSDGTR